jgi:hypothetical protein
VPDRLVKTATRRNGIEKGLTAIAVSPLFTRAGDRGRTGNIQLEKQGGQSGQSTQKSISF